VSATAVRPGALTRGAPAEEGAKPAPERWALQHTVAHVNLLPPEILVARRLERVQRLLAAGLAALLLVLGGAWWLSRESAADARADVAAQQAVNASLVADQAQYSEAPQLVAQLDRLESARATSMVSDVLWDRYLEAIGREYPEGVWLTDLAVTTDVAAQDTGAPAAATDPLAKPAVATISFTGRGGDYDDVAAWLDAMTDIDGFSDARYSLATRIDESGQPLTEFSSTVGVTADAFSHRFDQGSDAS
jgi:Tfp pilus assembly protein PilN